MEKNFKNSIFIWTGFIASLITIIVFVKDNNFFQEKSITNNSNLNKKENYKEKKTEDSNTKTIPTSHKENPKSIKPEKQEYVIKEQKTKVKNYNLNLLDLTNYQLVLWDLDKKEYFFPFNKYFTNDGLKKIRLKFVVNGKLTSRYIIRTASIHKKVRDSIKYEDHLNNFEDGISGNYFFKDGFMNLDTGVYIVKPTVIVDTNTGKTIDFINSDYIQLIIK